MGLRTREQMASTASVAFGAIRHHPSDRKRFAQFPSPRWRHLCNAGLYEAIAKGDLSFALDSHITSKADFEIRVLLARYSRLSPGRDAEQAVQDVSDVGAVQF